MKIINSLFVLLKPFREKFSFVFEITVLSLSLLGLFYMAYGIYLQAISSGRGFGIIGVDFFVLYWDMIRFLRTGILYQSPNNHFFNAPFMAFLCLPYALIPLSISKAIKLIVVLIIYTFSIKTIRHNSYDSRLPDRSLLFVLFCFTITFFAAQLYLLNVYVEVMLCLLLSVYYYKNSRYVLCAFFLALAAAFKFFLLPLLSVPIIARKYKLFLYATVFEAIFFAASLVIFGIDVYSDMIDAILIQHVDMKITLFESSVIQVLLHSGLAEIPLKMYVKGIIEFADVGFYNALIAIIYVIFSLILCIKIFTVAVKNRTRDYYPEIFSTLLIITLVFIFRYDFGILFLPVLPIIMGMKKIGKYAVSAILLMGIVYLFLYDLLKHFSLILPIELICFFPPTMLIGLFLNALLFYYWFTIAETD